MTDPYETGVLDPEVHDRLVADMERIALDAGIQKHWIWTPLGQVAEEPEVEWVRQFRKHADAGLAGLVYTGRKLDPTPETRMAAIAGALTRNFVRSRVMTVNQVAEAIKQDNPPMMRCLLIPNFFIEKAYGGSQPHWVVSNLLDLLISRHSRSLQTVLYVTDIDALGAEYGMAVRSHLESNYVMPEVE